VPLDLATFALLSLAFTTRFKLDASRAKLGTNKPSQNCTQYRVPNAAMRFTLFKETVISIAKSVEKHLLALFATPKQPKTLPTNFTVLIVARLLPSKWLSTVMKTTLTP
jgi:hypothetical protein